MRASNAVVRRAFADGRIRTTSYAVLFALFAYANAVGYRRSYPTIASRLAFAHSFGNSTAIRLFYGVPHDLRTVGGYCALRVGGIASILAAAWGVLAAVRALRAEEDAGRAELVLAGSIARRAVCVSALVAILAGAVLLWLALFAGLVAAHLNAGASAYLALAVVSPIPVFAGVGAVASQLAPTRRLALEGAVGVVAVAFLLRVIADTGSGTGWVDKVTPLGWPELLRAFAEPRPGFLVLPAATGAALLTAAGAIAARRDVGRGILRGHERAQPSLQLLASPTRLALRSERGTLAAWVGGVGFYAVVVGLLSTSFSGPAISARIRQALEKLGGSAIVTPAGMLGLYFFFFVVAISVFACSQIAAAAREESDQRLETLFALPVSRRRWLTGRLALAGAGVVVLSLAAGVFAWVGAASQHAGVSLPRLIEAGANCVPTALLFLALGALAYGVAPRASAGIAYGLVSVGFLWQLLGDLVGAPKALLDLTPFRHVGLVPAQPFRTTAALTMLALAGVAAFAAVRAFERRDLAGA